MLEPNVAFKDFFPVGIMKFVDEVCRDYQSMAYGFPLQGIRQPKGHITKILEKSKILTKICQKISTFKFLFNLC